MVQTGELLLLLTRYRGTSHILLHCLTQRRDVIADEALTPSTIGLPLDELRQLRSSPLLCCHLDRDSNHVQAVCIDGSR